MPITAATSEGTFSALQRFLTYLCSPMTEKRLNYCLLLHIHEELTDSMDLVVVARSLKICMMKGKNTLDILVIFRFSLLYAKL